MAPRTLVGNWAMMITKTACILNILGGIISFFYKTPDGGNKDLYMTTGIFGLTVGTLLLPFFWPCKFMGSMLLWHQYYYFAAITCFGLSIVDFLAPPTLLGGLSFASAGIVYLAAGIRGEKPLTVKELTSPR